MLFSRSLHIDLRPYFDSPRVPFGRLLMSWMKADFEPEACARILEKAIAERGLAPGDLDPEALLRGERLVSDAILFPKLNAWNLGLQRTMPDRPWAGFPLQDAQVPVIAELLRWAFWTEDQETLRKRLRFAESSPEFTNFFRNGEAAAPVWPDPTGPGIYRREHASLLIRSATTTLILDPIQQVRTLPQMDAVPNSSSRPQWDGIVITHSHSDHWHVPSILYHAHQADVPVIVPSVPRPSLLTPERFSDSLRAIGQRAIETEWNTTIKIGDIEIDILPFYGEQPTRTAPGAGPDLRSWGNCYRFTTPQFSAVVLVDAGADPDGDMLEVVRQSTAKRGRPDVLLSCCRKFDSPFFGGLTKYWAVLPFRRLGELYQQYRAGELPPTTAGPEGAAAICEASGAPYFLPYANGFEGLGQPITDVGWGQNEPSENETLDLIRARLVERGSKCAPVAWVPGDRATFLDGKLRIEPIRPQ